MRVLLRSIEVAKVSVIGGSLPSTGEFLQVQNLSAGLALQVLPESISHRWHLRSSLVRDSFTVCTTCKGRSQMQDEPVSNQPRGKHAYIGAVAKCFCVAANVACKVVAARRDLCGVSRIRPEVSGAVCPFVVYSTKLQSVMPTRS